MQITANGIDTHYLIDGKEGAPWVTFVTGIANDVTMWDGQISALANDFRILRYDLRGHGGTQVTAGDYSLPLLMGDLLALWDGLEIQKSSLVGLGLGGSISIGMGVKHSNRIAKLMPCCCRAVMTPDFAAMWPKFIDVVKQQGMEGMVEQTVQRWFTDDFKAANPEVLDSVRSMIRGTDPVGYEGVIKAFLTLDFSKGLNQISAPTLFVSGGDDHLGGPPVIMSGLAQAVPGARHVSVPNAAHIANIQNPAGFNAILIDFMRS